MSLQVWLPLNGNSNNYGISNETNITRNTGTYTDGKIGKSLHLVNTANILNATFPGIIDKTIWSITTWLKISSSEGTPNYQHFFNLGMNNDGSNSYFRFEHTGTAGYTQFITPKRTDYGSNTNGYWCFISGCNKAKDIWVHVAVTNDGTNYRTYFDGVLNTTTAINLFTPTTSKLTGTLQIGTANAYCYLNDFRIYDHCLSKKEIKEISKGLALHYSLSNKYNEDTTNLIDVQYKSSGGGGWGGHTSTWTEYDSTNDPIPCNKCTKMAITYSGSGNGGVGMAVKGISSSASTTYCYSCYVKTPDALGPLNTNILYRYEYDSNNTKTTEAGCWTSSNYQALGNNWYRLWGTFTTTASTARFDVYSFVYPNKTCDYYIGCWQLELKDHVTPYVLGSRSENVEYDSSGYKNDGIRTDTSIILNSPRYSCSTVFNGTTSNIDITSDIFPVVLNSDFTVTMWVYNNDVSGRSILFGNYGLTGSFFNIEKLTNEKVRFYWNGNPDIGFNNSIIIANAWTFLAVTRTGNTVKCYINGVLKDTSTTTLNNTIPTSAKNFRLGRDARSNDGTPLNGRLSDFRLYSVCLTDADIKELYNQPINFNKHSIMTQGEFIEK